MSDIFKIQCDISTSNPAAELGLEIWIDTNKIFDSTILEHKHFEYWVDDNDNDNRELKFVLKNKNNSHTIVDAAGNIVKDSTVTIENLKFDDIELGHMFYQLAEYRHNHNGHGNWAIEKFYGDMGCNGSVSLKFTTPIYLWMLENM